MKRAALLTLTIAGLAMGQAQAQNERIIEWVENAPESDPNFIALGYPVPIPVDTDLPFAGFRTYAGLHMRHQDLASTTPWVHPVQIGFTRDGRTIWAYRLGDADLSTVDGVPEQAMLTNGGIHAREWQSPEVTTGIMELLAESPADNHLISYLRDNANIIVIPVLNVDGFLQTQRYPDISWLGTDPGSPEFSPRDGRMRRKNMLGADEIMATQDDHLNGVDLNRNNDPYWATNPNRSSPDLNNIVHHGAEPASEPETRALDAAAQLGPAARLSMYTDAHSFSQVHFWVRNGNSALAAQTERLLGVFSNFHAAFPAGKFYAFNNAANTALNQGIGSTDEYFTHAYEVPSWTLEIEPRNPGSDYGGLARNGHDGFILPEAEVPRVRTELAETFAVAYYRQSRPPTINAIKVFDQQTGALVFDAEWDPSGDGGRALFTHQPQAIQLGRDYRIWMAHDKPMRWREGGQVVPLPGQPGEALDIEVVAKVEGQELSGASGNLSWHDTPGGAPEGYVRYRDDAVSFDATLPADAINSTLVNGETAMTLLALNRDMTNQQTDANPSTVAHWGSGHWLGYEDADGLDVDTGGPVGVNISITDQDLGDPFVVEAGTSSAWFDPQRDGEGFVLEILPGKRAVMYWFTYNPEGGQDWYIAVGEVVGNRVVFAELLQVSGGVFGPGFDPDAVTETVVGSASFAWSGCDSGVMKWQIGAQSGRMNLTRLSRLMGVPCGGNPLPPELAGHHVLSGSWYDPSHAGEGYTLEIMDDGRALVYWFGFGPTGERRWFFGIGSIEGAVLDFPGMLTSRGAVFGAGFDPADVEILPWGTLELEIGCDGGEARFVPMQAGFAAGTLDLARLSSIENLECP